MKYRPDIDGLRALAVVSVMVYHLAPRWLPGGFIGVDVFFVISGFVVCASLAASEHIRLSGFIAEFYARRLARIIPALVAMLAVASVVSTLFVPKAWVTRLNDQTVQSRVLRAEQRPVDDGHQQRRCSVTGRTQPIRTHLVPRCGGAVLPALSAGLLLLGSRHVCWPSSPAGFGHGCSPQIGGRFVVCGQPLGD